MLDIKRVLAAAPHKQENVALKPLLTPWGEQVAKRWGVPLPDPPKGDGDNGLPAHPHPPKGDGDNGLPARPHPCPQFAREEFCLLDGWWDYAIVPADDPADAWEAAAAPDAWDGRILVPFSPEALLSGVRRQVGPGDLLWYRREFEAPAGLRRRAGQRLILHFEAGDWACACFCNGVHVGSHAGGYAPFAFDVTDALAADGSPNLLTLCVFDPSDAGVQPRGKQKIEHADIWYTAQSGIWQSVWMEAVPQRRICSVDIDADADTGKLTVTAALADSETAGEHTAASAASLSAAFGVRLMDGDRVLAESSSCEAVSKRAAGEASAADVTHSLAVRFCTVTLDVPAPRLWSPDDPHLYDLDLRFGDDRVRSYCAFRTVGVEPDAQGVPRFCLNHEPLFLRGVLDQGYWSDGLLTAPADEALVADIQAARAAGFNMMRKHIKVESARWYYHCDRLGMLVWQDMVSGGSPYIPWHVSYKPTFFRSSWGRVRDDDPKRFGRLSAESPAFRDEWTRTCVETVRLLKNHPSVVTWVLFNEGWGQFEARKATQMVRGLDPTRPIDAVSGWYDQACGDFLSVHNYFRPLEVYPDRAGSGRAFVISEFGGLSFQVAGHSALDTSYGYGAGGDAAEYRAGVRDALAQADALEAKGLAGFVYTQLSDVEEETNGILTYDRRVNKLES